MGAVTAKQQMQGDTIFLTMGKSERGCLAVTSTRIALLFQIVTISSGKMEVRSHCPFLLLPLDGNRR